MRPEGETFDALAEVRAALDQYQNAPFRSADWLANRLMDIINDDDVKGEDPCLGTPNQSNAMRDALDKGERFLRKCNSAWACGEPEHRVKDMLRAADDFQKALDALSGQGTTLNYDTVKEAVTAHWGERCADFEPGCPCCDAWAQLDALTGEKPSEG